VTQKIVWNTRLRPGSALRRRRHVDRRQSGVQGRGSGELWVYAADTGKVLKVVKTGSHIMAAP